MAAKARKPASATTKSTSTVSSTTTTTATPALAPIVTDRLAQSAPFASYSPQQSNLVKDIALGPAPAGIQVHVGADHRPNQPFQGAAPVRPLQQSPNLSGGQQNQQSYAVQGVFSPQPALQSSYQHTNPQYQPQQTPTENPYYSSNPSPRSTHSSAYYTAEKPENMAAATATMQRPYHQTYHTPQSNSPASVTSPQTHDQSRQMFQPHAQLQPGMFYHHYSSMGHPTQQPIYGHTAPTPMNPPPLLTYQPNTASMPLPQIPSQANTIQSSPSLKSDSSRQYTPQIQPPLAQRHSSTPVSQHLPMNQSPAPPSTSNAAPGPIPATTPLVVHQDASGVQWIAFEYSRDRVKLEYTIRCDVESVDTTSLTQEFKGENCVYPRACVPKEQYKGNRLSYETECNQVGWALAELNPCLRGKRGLIQRAVDSWRNSNRDPKLRSRRVRRQAKLHNRTKMAASSAAQAGPAPGLSSSNPLGGLNQRTGAALPSNSQQMQQHHHHTQHDSSPTGQDSVAASAYGPTPGLQRAPSNSQHLTSPSEIRQAQAFPGYQSYPTGPSSMGSSMAPPIHGSMHHYGRPSGSGAMLSKMQDEDSFDEIDLFGELPSGKRRKFILVDDAQKTARVRVKVTLDQVDTSEIPDSYRKHNSVYPRSYSPVQIHPATQFTHGGRFVEEDVEDTDDAPPIAGRVTVPCQLASGEGEIEVSQLSREKRRRERKVNELGYRMAWGQSRVFSGRPVFLGRALDVYRTKQCEALKVANADDTTVPRHLETRPGKRRWLKTMRSGQDVDVPTSYSE